MIRPNLEHGQAGAATDTSQLRVYDAGHTRPDNQKSARDESGGSPFYLSGLSRLDQEHPLQRCPQALRRIGDQPGRIWRPPPPPGRSSRTSTPMVEVECRPSNVVAS